MRLFVVLVLAVALAGCGPSELEKARVRLDLAKEEYEELDAKVKDFEEQIQKLPTSNQQAPRKELIPLKELRSAAFERLEEARVEVEQLAN